MYRASVVELVYTADLKSAAARIKGSSPFTRTIYEGQELDDSK